MASALKKVTIQGMMSKQFLCELLQLALVYFFFMDLSGHDYRENIYRLENSLIRIVLKVIHHLLLTSSVDLRCASRS